MFLTFPYIDQAIALKFRLVSIHFTSEGFEAGRTMSVMDISPVINERPAHQSMTYRACPQSS